MKIQDDPHPKPSCKKVYDHDKIELLIKNYDASLNEWKRYQYWNPKEEYTRNLIATDNKHFTLMLLCWNPKMGSPIHNHSGCDCFMRIIKGEIIETRYVYPKDDKFHKKIVEAGSVDDGKWSGLDVIQESKLVEGDVRWINDMMGVHKMENEHEVEGSVTMHCYIPPYAVCHTFEKKKDGKMEIEESEMSYATEHGNIK
ncbi:unnamed protein product [Didymodactylos carnosus]|uniref:Cysteine dioxygenase n=1 Tax=Didymodactylos carnosus TaxID=1234261 RepID=A0A813XDC9_9BILA|nr:unnamed protein product [Didymodactylos carnosus]CAF1458784.1 unnamed protein product [Didymodactylos carnosus]CAF3658755.1 unnamed protein product [Didymodactylos carnosus]CAF4252467.1 unnamed protein product [Didymodactylos carnosus]